MKPADPPKRPRGRPRLPDGPKVKITIRITPVAADRLTKQYGSPEEGLRQLAERGK